MSPLSVRIRKRRRTPETHRDMTNPVQPSTSIASHQQPAAASHLLAITATFTADPLRAPLAFWLAKLGLDAQVEFAPYSQVFQELLDHASLLSRNSGGMNIVLVRLEDWDAHPGAAEKNARDLVAALRSATARSSAAHLLCFCPSHSTSRQIFYDSLEQGVCEELAGNNGVHCVTSAAMQQVYPVSNFYDAIRHQLGHIPYTSSFFAALATLVTRRFVASSLPPRKVIVLDCDNTLWTGVCGEVGPSGITVEEERRFLQQYMREQMDAGMLLCVCSKNQEEDVDAVFRERTDMPLKREHFVSWRVNWEAKSQNLRSLAKELNLGLDSFIFLDDNLVECAEVRAHCPEVLTLQLPGHGIPSFLKHVWAFDHSHVTEEDRQRTLLYRRNVLRQQSRSEATSLADFLSKLELEIIIEELTPAQLERAAQLTQRTNQFNFTTRRRSPADIQKLCALPDYHALTVSVRDRFGEHGLVGLIIYTSNQEALEIDSFLLSCRVLNRGVEHRMLAHLGAIAQVRGLQFVDACFLETTKNKPALDFLNSCGVQLHDAAPGQTIFRFPAAVASSLEFNPNGPVPDETEQTSKPERAPARPAVALDSSLVEWIASNSSDLNQLLFSMEATAATGSHATNPAHYVPPRTETEHQVVRIWEHALRVTPVGIHDDFFRLGGDSLEAVTVLSEVEQLTGKSLPMLTFLEASTVAKLAAVLDHVESIELAFPESPSATPPSVHLAVPGANDAEEHAHAPDCCASQSRLTKLLSAPGKPVHVSCLNSGGPGTPVFWIPGGGGLSVLAFRRISSLIQGRAVYGLEASVEQSRKPIDLRLKASQYIDALQSQRSAGPYYLFGFSAGSWLAYEMAVQLEAAGQQSLLVVFDMTVRGYPSPLRKIGTAFQVFTLHCGKMLSLPVSRWAPFTSRIIKERFRRMKENSTVRNWKGDEDGLDLFTIAEYHNLRAAEAYRISRPASFSGDIRVVLASESIFDGVSPDLDPRLGWAKLATGGVQIFRVPGNHLSMLQEPHVNALADALQQILTAADREHQPQS
jgi:FkbH-like protein